MVKDYREELLETQKLYLDNYGNLRRPHLVVITIGNDDASNVYIKNKKRACEKCDIQFEHLVIDENTNINNVTNIIKSLNADTSVDGVIVQRPGSGKFKGIEQLVIT